MAENENCKNEYANTTNIILRRILRYLYNVANNSIFIPYSEAYRALSFLTLSKPESKIILSELVQAGYLNNSRNHGYFLQKKTILFLRGHGNDLKDI